MEKIKTFNYDCALECLIRTLKGSLSYGKI